MAREYDVVCLNCGEIIVWCKYDSPEEKCPRCNVSLSDGDNWNNNVKIFGCGRCSSEVCELSEEIKKENPKYWIIDSL